MDTMNKWEHIKNQIIDFVSESKMSKDEIVEFYKHIVADVSNDLNVLTGGETVELTNKGQIKKGETPLWAISVYNQDDDYPILLFDFFDTYPSKEQVRDLMYEQYIDWVGWVDEGGYEAETVYVN